jgi:DNA-binding CsgD family transcriptional regulator
MCRLRSLLGEETRGLVLAGPPGVGKTRLAVEYLKLARAADLATVRVTATRASARLPLSVFAPLLIDDMRCEDRAGDDRTHLIHRCAAALVAVAKGRRLVLMVDDAHLLDDGSATLVQQLIAMGAAFVVATLVTGEPAPDPVRAMLKDDSVERMEVRALSPSRVEQLLTTTLAGPVDPGMATRLTERSKGNVLFLRELVIGAIEDGTLVQDTGIWRLTGPIRPSTWLAELVEGRLADLAPAERDLVEIIAFGQPLGIVELGQLGKPEIAESLERRGLLTSSVDGGKLQIRLAHPLFADVLRSRTPALRAQKISRLLAAALEEAGTSTPEDVLRIGTWRLDGGGGDPGLLVAAAGIARQRYDFPLAERLVEAALGAGAGFDAAILGVQLKFLLGRCAEAESACNDLMEMAGTDQERHLVAMTALDHRSFMAGKNERGARIAEEMEIGIRDPERRDEVAAKRAALVAGFEGPSAAVALAEPLLERSSGRAYVWSAIAAGYAFSRVGRLGAALEVSTKGFFEHCRLSESLEWYPWTHLFVRCEALAYSGRLVEAHALAKQQHERSLLDGSPEAQAWFAWQLCKTVQDRGSPRSAAIHGRSAVVLFRQLGQPQFQHFVLGHLSMALALAGRADEARQCLAALDDLGLECPLYWACDVYQARAWVAVIDGEIECARQLLEQGQRLARSIGDQIGESVTLHMMARIGFAGQVSERLATLATLIEGNLVALRSTHTDALVKADPRMLETVSASFESCGALILAAEAAADAAVAWRRTRDTRRAAKAEYRANLLSQICENPETPVLRMARGRSRLTRAEHNVARLAASGASNQSIADRLFVSRRTVENQLQHVYDKLGVCSRQELSTVLREAPRDVSTA